MLLDALFVNGRFRTLDRSRPTARSVGVLSGFIAGFDDDLRGCRAHIVYDLKGAPAVPGLHDAHHHLTDRGLALLQCDLSPTVVANLEELYQALTRWATRQPTEAWVLGTGFDDVALGGLPTRSALDAVADGRPVWITHRSTHLGVANTEALRRAGCADPDDVADLDGGVIGRESDNSLSGVLAERAMSRVLKMTRPAPFERLVDAIARGSEAALADGLTSVTEPGISGLLSGNGPTDLAAFQTALERGLLGPRLTLMPELAALHEVAGAVDRDGFFGLDLGIRTGLGDDAIRIGAVKIFGDGALTTRTAALSRAYSDTPGARGLLLEDPEVLRDQVLAAHRAGWQIATHAIGDAAISAVLDAYEHAQSVAFRPDPRHRIEHCGLTTDAQLRRIKALAVIPVPQGRFIAEFGPAYRTAVGADRAELLFRQRSFLDAGIVIPGSSDCPVVDGSPLRGIQALVTRAGADGEVLGAGERLTVWQALRAYTLGSAYADRQEHRKGALAPGKLGDFVVLSDDILQIPADRIGDVAVYATVIGGRVRHGELAIKAA